MKLIIIARNRKDQTVAAVLADNENLARAYFQGASIEFDHLDMISPDESGLPAVTSIVKTRIAYMSEHGERYEDHLVVAK